MSSLISFSIGKHEEFKNPEDLSDYPGIDIVGTQTTDFTDPYHAIDVSICFFIINDKFQGSDRPLKTWKTVHFKES